jgi:hypothetical protein
MEPVEIGRRRVRLGQHPPRGRALLLQLGRVIAQAFERSGLVCFSCASASRRKLLQCLAYRVVVHVRVGECSLTLLRRREVQPARLGPEPVASLQRLRPRVVLLLVADGQIGVSTGNAPELAQDPHVLLAQFRKLRPRRLWNPTFVLQRRCLFEQAGRSLKPIVALIGILS